MSTLLLRLAGPLQSWGNGSKFERRYTGRTPTKSGVVGMCASAIGHRRDEDEKIDSIAKLRFGVRIDRPGTLLKDFHTTHEETFWNPADRSKINHQLTQEKKNKYSYVTTRYYLSDAAFLVGLEGEDSFLLELDEALRFPMFPLFLGRRGCPPEGRVALGVVSVGLCEALQKQPPVVEMRQSWNAESAGLRIVMDAVRNINDDSPERISGSYLQRDIPLSFNPIHRRFDFRSVCEFEAGALHLAGNIPDHDAMSVVEEVTPCL